jgi:hypothetical protein
MIKRKKIYLKIFILIVLFSFQGINLHSNSEILRHHIEISKVTDDNENRLTTAIDSSDEDQIDRSYLSYLLEQPESQIYKLTIQPLPNTVFFSVWQPPKIS